MDSKQIAPIMLTLAEAETHVIEISYYDDAETKIKGRWVTRKSDRKRDGRMLSYSLRGTLSEAGTFKDDIAVGTWWSFLEDGSLSSEDVVQSDGTVLQTIYDHGRRTGHGLARADAHGQLRRDGWWWIQKQVTERPHEERFRMGETCEKRPVLAMLQTALAKGAVKYAYESLAGSDLLCLYSGVLGLLETGDVVLDIDTALALASLSHPFTLPTALKFVAPFKAEAMPKLEAEAHHALMDRRTAQRVALFLWNCGPSPLDPKYDPLLAEALSCSEYDSRDPAVIDLFSDLLRAMPIDRRERHVLRDTDWHTHNRADLLFVFAHTAPTLRVLSVALENIAAFPKSRFRGNPSLELAVKSTLAAFGTDAVPTLTAWLAGPGQKAPQRSLVLEALADLAVPSAAATLLAFAEDSLVDARNAARAGLDKLGAAAIPALTAVAKNKKGKLKTLAEQLLAARQPSEGTAVSAGQRTVVPASSLALAALRASISDDEQQQIRALMTDNVRETEARLKQAVESNLAKAVVVFAEFAIAHAQGRPSTMCHQVFANCLRSVLANHDAFPALLAELLVAMPALRSTGSADPLAYWLNEGALTVLDPLGWLFEKQLPAAAQQMVGHLASTHPWEARRVLIASAKGASKDVRTEAVRGLVRCGARVIPEVLPLLHGSDAGVLSATAVLRALPPDPSAIDSLAQAIAKEKDKKRLDALREALAACQQASGGNGIEPDVAILDSDLSRRASRRKKKLPQIPNLPALHFRQGPALSEGATQWLLGALYDETDAEPSVELARVRKLLTDEDASALLSAIDGALPFANEHRWKIYAVGLLGNDRQLSQLGERLRQWNSGGLHVLAGHAIESLRRNGTGSAVRWIDHWAEEGSGKLQLAAQSALVRLCAERGVDRHTLVDLSTPHTSDNERETLAWIAGRLEGAMILGRRFDAALFDACIITNPLFRQAATGLVFLGNDGTPGLWGTGGFTDAASKPCSLAMPVSIPHPCELTNEQLAGFQDVLVRLGIAQPLGQLNRPFSRTPESDLLALRNQKIDTGQMRARLQALGYRRGDPQDGGVVYDAYRSIAPGWILEADHDGYVAATGRPTHGRPSVLHGIRAHPRDHSLARPTAAMLCEALSDLRKVLGH